MPDDTIPLAAHRKALREAFEHGSSLRRDLTTDQIRAEAMRRWPEPEPELRWVQTGTAYEYARNAQGKWYSRPLAEPDLVSASIADDKFVRALASRLPREPVAVTEAMVAKAEAAFFHDPTGDDAKSFEASMRAALLAVAADLAGPVGEKPKAQWWGFVDKEGVLFACLSRTDAEETARQYNEREHRYAPHRVVGLAEVEDEANSLPERRPE